jgi:hypothetical protein
MGGKKMDKGSAGKKKKLLVRHTMKMRSQHQERFLSSFSIQTLFFLIFSFILFSLPSLVSSQGPIPPYEISKTSEVISKLPDVQISFTARSWEDILSDASIPVQFHSPIVNAVSYAFIVTTVGTSLMILLCLLGCFQACNAFRLEIPFCFSYFFFFPFPRSSNTYFSSSKPIRCRTLFPFEIFLLLFLGVLRP